MNLGLRKKILGGIFIPVGLLVVTGISSVYGINTMRETEEWVEHTHQVIEQADAIVAGAVNMETGMRGFALSGKENFLEPYIGGDKQAFDGIAALKVKVNDNPAQVERLEKAETILSDWKEKVAEQNIALRREINVAMTVRHLADQVGKGEGKKHFDAFRGHVAKFIAVERDLLEKRQAAFKVENAVAAEIREAQRWITHTYQVIDQAGNILAAAINMETGLRGYLLAGKDDFLEPFNTGRDQFESLTESLAGTVRDNPPQVALVRTMQETMRAWQDQIAQPMIKLRRDIQSGKTMDDMAMLIGQEKGKTFFDAFRAVMNEVIAEEKRLLVIRGAEQEAAQETSFLMIVLIGLTAVIISSVVGVYISRSILKQVGGEPDQIAALTDKVAGGDLTIRFGTDASRMSGILESVKSMVENMRAVHLSIVEASSKISNNVREISGSSGEQASGAAQQAAAISEIVATLDEMQRTSQETLDQALELGESAKVTQEEGERGVTILKTMMASMESIRTKVEKIAEANLALSEHSKNIGQITQTINALMQQSKMLGINASIEASKAGEVGKGFAVVAEEIHNLAERSEESTEQVHKILSDVQRATENAVMATEEGSKEVNLGLELIDQTRQAILKLNGVINQTVGKTDQIVASVRQGTMGINQVSSAMGQINDATQNFVGATAQVRDAADGLITVVDELNESVSVYRV